MRVIVFAALHSVLQCLIDATGPGALPDRGFWTLMFLGGTVLVLLYDWEEFFKDVECGCKGA